MLARAIWAPSLPTRAGAPEAVVISIMVRSWKSQMSGWPPNMALLAVKLGPAAEVSPPFRQPRPAFSAGPAPVRAIQSALKESEMPRRLAGCSRA